MPSPSRNASVARSETRPSEYNSIVGSSPTGSSFFSPRASATLRFDVNARESSSASESTVASSVGVMASIADSSVEMLSVKGERISAREPNATIITSDARLLNQPPPRSSRTRVFAASFANASRAIGGSIVVPSSSAVSIAFMLADRSIKSTCRPPLAPSPSASGCASATAIKTIARICKSKSQLKRIRWNGVFARRSASDRDQSNVLEMTRRLRRNLRNHNATSGARMDAPRMAPASGVTHVSARICGIESICVRALIGAALVDAGTQA